MSDNGTKDILDKVYSGESPEEVARDYDEWAERYDDDMAKAGYRHPSICLALLARHADPDAGAVLDAGAGTGLLGEWLRIIGYAPLAALDASRGMLDVARRKELYDELEQGFIGESLPFATDRFAAAVAAGVFTLGHVGPEGLDDLLRVVAPGGIIVLTVKDKLYDEGGFGERLESLIADNRCTRVEETPSYLSMPRERSTSTSRALVLRVA